MYEKPLKCAAILLILINLSVYAEFVCTEKGLFPDPASNDCKSFYSCNSKLESKIEQCNEGTYFSPEFKGCFSSYNCATRSMPQTADPCIGFTYDRIPDKFSEDCSEYFYCQIGYSWNNGEQISYSLAVTEKCPAGTAFNYRRYCDSRNKCSQFECTEVGEFENPDANDCSTFVRCSEYKKGAQGAQYDGTGSVTLLYSEIITCPENTKYNPFVNKCDSFYKCNGVDKHRGKDPCRKYNWAHPYVPNPYDKSGKSYILCEDYFDAYYNYYAKKPLILKKTCPKDTFFNPVSGFCYNNYDPNDTCPKDACVNGPGQYVNYKSGKCETYIECRNDASTPALYELSYEIRYCPEGTNFDPKTRKCSKQYVCPVFPENYCYDLKPTTTAPTTTTAAAAA